ncbi:hypothetical protein BGZ67_000959, partial [Mortierella alpina]
GAVAWYKNKDLSKQPPVMLQAFHVYNDENDKLQQFIDNVCEVGKSYYVNQGQMREAYEKDMHMTIQQIKLAVLMAEKGFNASKTRINGKQEKIYNGLRLKNSGNTL